MKLFDLKANLQSQLSAAREAASRGDDRQYGDHMAATVRIQKEIAAIEGSPNNSIRRMQSPEGVLLADNGPRPANEWGRRYLPSALAGSLHAFIMSGGKAVDPGLLDQIVIGAERCEILLQSPRRLPDNAHLVERNDVGL